MFAIFNLILVFFLAVFFIGVWFIFRILYSVLNIRKQFNTMGDEMRGDKRRQHHQSDKETVSDHRPQQKADRKIFSDNEGEYVDFEEVK